MVRWGPPSKTAAAYGVYDSHVRRSYRLSLAAVRMLGWRRYGYDVRAAMQRRKRVRIPA